MRKDILTDKEESFMNNFVQWTPTEVVFGRGTENQTGEETAKWGGTRALIVFGGGSAKKSGLLDRVEASLDKSGIAWEEYGGVRANPTLTHAQEGVRKAISMKADFILGVGGGSVIDTAKAIAHGTANPETDLWDIWTQKVPLTKTMPFGVVLTIPAAGSEMSDSAVLTNEAIPKKTGINTPFNRCKFAIMNPEIAATLPKKQLRAGISDIMMHTMERYFISGIRCDLTDEIAEGLLRTMIKDGPVTYKDPSNYDTMAEVMWCSSISHNNLTECGRGKDFSVHKIGMPLSARYDATHGDTLTAVWGSWARFQCDGALDRFARYARTVWGIQENDDQKAAQAGIKATEDFFKSIDMPISIGEMMGRTLSDDELDQLAADATGKDTIKLSRIKKLGQKEVREIYAMANH